MLAKGSPGGNSEAPNPNIQTPKKLNPLSSKHEFAARLVWFMG